MIATRKYSYFFLVAGAIAFYCCKKEYSCENCRPKNLPPTANAGNDTSITLPADSIVLDGSKSFDPDDGIASFKWTKIYGPDTFNIRNNIATITTVTGVVKATYWFELTVTDKAGLFAKDTVRVLVNPVVVANRPPIARAGNDTLIILPVNNVILDGSRSSDPDNNIAGYAWKKISGPASSFIANGNAVQVQLSNLQQGIYQVELTVTDAGGLISKDTVRIVVKSGGTNLPPVAIAGPDQDNILSTCSIVLDGSSSYDPDGSIVSAKWTMIGGAATMGIVYPDSLVTPLSGFNTGVFVYRLEVTDNMGLIGADTIQIKSTNAFAGKEVLFDDTWGCNDVCADGDVYWVGGDYCDPHTAVEVTILLDTSSTWIEVRQQGSPPPAINQFSWKIYNGMLWVMAYEGKLIRTRVKIKAKYL